MKKLGPKSLVDMKFYSPKLGVGEIKTAISPSIIKTETWFTTQNVCINELYRTRILILNFNLMLTDDFGPNFLTCGLEKVYPRFCERPDGPLPESAE